MKKISQFITKISKKSAITQTEWLCGSFMHQPKVPEKLLKLKNPK